MGNLEPHQIHGSLGLKCIPCGIVIGSASAFLGNKKVLEYMCYGNQGTLKNMSTG